MNKKIANSVLIFRMITICLLTALSAFGCATVPDSSVAAGPRLEPAPLPSYSQGTTFVYADGKWETVIDNSSGIITWKDHRNYAYSGSPDFSHRPSQWQSKTRSVTRQFGPRTDVFIQSATTLWPLRVGNAASYSETGTWVSKGGAESFYQTAWSCAVTGTERVSVMAGDFDTYKIVCKRYSVSKKKKNRTRLREAKTWNYAPAVGIMCLPPPRITPTKNRADRNCLPCCRPSTAFRQERAGKWRKVFSRPWNATKAARPSAGRVPSYGLRWKPCPPKPLKQLREATAAATFRN